MDRNLSLSLVPHQITVLVPVLEVVPHPGLVSVPDSFQVHVSVLLLDPVLILILVTVPVIFFMSALVIIQVLVKLPIIIKLLVKILV